MPEPLICLHDVTKEYSLYKKRSHRLLDAFGLIPGGRLTKLRAIDSLSLCVPQGQTLGIIGENGSGKSTLLKIITGIVTPSSGNRVVKGRISALLELGAGFNPEYTGLENIYLNAEFLGITKSETEQKLPQILDFAGIGEYIRQPVKTYSSGMFVRLAFALSVNVDPDILIVDEALSVGDIFFQSKCYRKFMEFKQAG